MRFVGLVYIRLKSQKWSGAVCETFTRSHKNTFAPCLNRRIRLQKLIERKDPVTFGSIFGKRALLAIDHIMLALFWSYVPNRK